MYLAEQVSTHSRPKAADLTTQEVSAICKVSTHSRPKAADYGVKILAYGQAGFNTQPPEGG